MGVITEAAVWDRALSGSEIAALCSNKSVGDIAVAPWNSHCVALWHMSEGVGTVCADSSGYGHDLNLTGGISWITLPLR